MKTSILFVDDEPQIVELLQLILAPVRHDWDAQFALGPEEALELLDQQTFDVVVSDMRMPNMTGDQLLARVMEKSPRTVRVILSGYADQEQALRCIGVVHQFLAKPFTLDQLLSVLQRLHRLNHWLLDDQLRSLVAGMRTLPSVPTMYFQIMQALESPDSTLDQIGEVIATDPGLTVKILQLVNSAFFGFSSRVISASEAVQMLGAHLVRSLTLSCQVFSAFETTRFRTLSLDRVWNHSLSTAMIARRIARAEGASETITEEAFTAGTLHDVGKLVLAANLPDRYAEALAYAERTPCNLQQAESKVFGVGHADVGTFMLGLWGLPISLVEAVALHHEPRQSSDTHFTPLTAIHVANALAHASDGGNHTEAGIDLDYLACIGLDHRLEAWRAAAAAD